ncbi:hypothetical protein JTE90_012555 [Oedothorax gibbosus]|uniref:C2H2-type domain-containing protein n=1 Tax=Oedothorax gibbosus TaxID=931172 RepID=A0AAV6TYE3_9ARAC|nr:hypothetical protein JTE90_012555 [Oedothorax gibbosus]
MLTFRNFAKSLIATPNAKDSTTDLLKCSMCSYSTQGKQQFDIHCARHLRHHKYSCDYCKKGFVTKNEAVVHMRVHTGEKPFGCDVCKKSFRHKHTLNVHLKTHCCRFCTFAGFEQIIVTQAKQVSTSCNTYYTSLPEILRIHYVYIFFLQKSGDLVKRESNVIAQFPAHKLNTSSIKSIKRTVSPLHHQS